MARKTAPKQPAAPLTLNIKTTVGSYRRLLRLLANFKDVGSDVDIAAAADLMEDATAWLVAYGGADEDALDDLDLADFGYVLKQAEQAFGGVIIPQPKSAT